MMNPHCRSADEVARDLGTDPVRGLSAAEAVARLGRYGANELRTMAGVPAWRRLLAQFEDVLVWLLLAAAVISGLVWWLEHGTGLPYESLVILAVVGLNALLGFVQEDKAEKALAALRAMAAPEATVVRDGEPRRVPARELVPGDVLIVNEGDKISADARLLEAVELHTLEASLTGESLPVLKGREPVAERAAIGDRLSMIFAGTAASSGHGRAVVTATGMATELGQIAGLLQTTKSPATPLQRDLDRIGRQLGLMVVAIAAGVVTALLSIYGVSDARTVVQVLMFGVALAVAAAPEGLSAVVTVVLALGVQRMARRGAIVRKLPAVETLGSATVIASDKTGTLTRNEMTVRVLLTAAGRVEVSGTGYDPAGELLGADGEDLLGDAQSEGRRLLRAAALCNNAQLQQRDGSWGVVGDPTEAALLVAARKAGLDLGELADRFPRVGEAPFTSERKRMSTLHREGAGYVIFAKGAPGQLLECCTHELTGDEPIRLTAGRRERILREIDSLGAEALRTLGAAYRRQNGEVEAKAAEWERELVYLGTVGMMDPPRAEAKAAVAKAKSAGIRPVVITGDHPATALSIARLVGITEGDRVLTGEQIGKLSDGELEAASREVAVYARVSPHHKLRIVQALQRTGEIVAMTGDGVNDAPALQTADIGVAMGMTGTDVSKEAADLVLTDDNFATIVVAVEEGRAVFDNIRKFLRYLLSSNVGEVLTMFFAVLLAKPLGLNDEGGFVLPLLATQILWINLVTDGAPALALGVDPAQAGLMNQPPRPRGEAVINGRMRWGVALVGMVMAAGTLLVFDAALPGGLIEGSGSLDYGRTMAFTTLVFFQLFNALNARSDEHSVVRGLFANRRLWAAIGVSVGLHGLLIYAPFLQKAFGAVRLSGADWVECVAVASTVVGMAELVKLARRRA